MADSRRDILIGLFRAAVSSVKGDISVSEWLADRHDLRPTHVVAIGKAALAMFEGLPDDWRTTIPTYLVTKTGHLGGQIFGLNVQAYETSHPVPDQLSLKAGKGLLDFVADCPADSRLMMLVSGGASSLVEHLRTGVSSADLVAFTQAALAEGADIRRINRRRREISAIKGGGLLSAFKGERVDVLAVSDVAGNSISVIGSGIGAPPERANFTYNCYTIASNAVAREAVVQAAASLGIATITNQESMYADIAEVAGRITKEIMEGPDGLYVYGGEPTVVLPKDPGNGGRNQALALELARRFKDRNDLIGLVVGSDGTDGPTDAAGAYFDSSTYEKQPGAEAAQKRADSGRYLSGIGDTIATGPTGTNVMDLAIILKGPLGSAQHQGSNGQ